MKHIAFRAVQDHRRIFEAFCSGDPARLCLAAFKSYDGWKESLNREKGWVAPPSGARA